MTVTSGFFNSFEHDRRYGAPDFSRIFNGIINDGIFMSVGDTFMVTELEEPTMEVLVGTGRAWFDGSWTHNDAPFILPIPVADNVLNRLDTIVIETNFQDDVRANTIKLLQGVPATNPVAPTLIRSEYVNQYALCDVYVGKNVTTIIQANITNHIGGGDTPFVTGILQTINIDSLIAQWQSEWTSWKESIESDQETWTTEQRDAYISWRDQQESDMETWSTNFRNEFEVEFNTWFDNMKGQLSTDAAGNLQLQIDAIAKLEFERYYGMMDKTTHINKDSDGDLVAIVENSDESVATTTMSKVGDVQTIITVLVMTNEPWKYTKTVVIEPDGYGISITENYAKELK